MGKRRVAKKKRVNKRQAARKAVKSAKRAVKKAGKAVDAADAPTIYRRLTDIEV